MGIGNSRIGVVTNFIAVHNGTVHGSDVRNRTPVARSFGTSEVDYDYERMKVV